MMHVDKNANGYVVDQNVDRISREIAYIPLGRGIRSKRSSCMQIFFLNEFKTCLPVVMTKMRILVVLSKGPTILNFGRASQRSDRFEVWMCFQEVQWIEFGCASQKSDGFVEGRRTKVDPINVGRTKVDPLEVGEVLSILQCIGELKSIL